MDTRSTEKDFLPFTLLVIFLVGVLVAVKIYDTRTQKLDEIGKKLYSQIVGL